MSDHFTVSKLRRLNLRTSFVSAAEAPSGDPDERGPRDRRGRRGGRLAAREAWGSCKASRARAAARSRRAIDDAWAAVIIHVPAAGGESSRFDVEQLVRDVMKVYYIYIYVPNIGTLLYIVLT